MTAENLEKYAITTAIFAGLGVGGYLVLKGQIAKAKVAKVEETSLDAGSASNLAQRLKMAFENDNYFGLGTDVEAVYAVFNELKRQSDYQQVKDAYTTLFKSSLDADLRDELNIEEWNNVQKIFAKKPKK